ncbi:MAG TPA: DUF58 domain-containing protein [Chthoniobacteraceae bacterium]
MIAPHTRLIFWTAAVVLPFAALAGAAPQTLVPAVAIILLFAVLVVADALRAGGGLLGVSIEMPSVVRWQNGRSGTLPLEIRHPAGTARLLRVGIAFPREIESEKADYMVRLPDGSEASRFDWSCRPTQRGQFRLHDVHVEASSPFGFWAARATLPAQCEIRVYPDLYSERAQTASLFLRRAGIGIHSLRYAGQGRDFEKLREFVPGDSLPDIHWKASAKRGKPVTKVFQIERSQEIYLVIDGSRLSARQVVLKRPLEKTATAGAFATVETTALERYVTAALLLALSAERQGDQFGLLTFSDRVLSFVRARSGQAHFDACRDRLYTLQPENVSPDFEEVCTFLRLRLRKRAMIVFLTALDDPVLAENFEKATALICRQQLVLANMLEPPETGPLFSEKSPVASVDDLYRRLGGHYRWNNLRELQKTLGRKGVRLSFLDPDRISAELIAQHAEVRARQLL